MGMAKGQVKKVQMQTQTENVIFALDIGTRSVIGMVGVIEDEKVKIIAIEKEEHTERAMIDGQIENIEKVAVLAGKIKKRLEAKVHFKLNHVCVAAAGRALRTKRAEFEIDLHNKQVITEEIISRLEAGAIGKVEEAFDAENSAEDDTRRFYLVGYTVCQYFLDEYRISSLKDHRGQNVKVDLIATFLPSEVVESLYTTMNKIGLEVVSVTLEPIAAINAAIPENLRLLNLVMVDIGAGTSDIAACTGGSVTGYTMATVAGDEITEKLMHEYLVDFATSESMKAQIEKEEVVTFTDILGFERKASKEEILQCIQGTLDMLCKEIAGKVLEVNGSAPSALFLAGGGSKLAGLKEGITAALQMDANRVAVAGNNFRISAFSDDYDLNNPEYATPLGITISSGLNLINDSFRVTLNGRPAKLFRSGTFTALNLLMMNGFNFQDVMGRPGSSLSVTVNGKRKAFYGTAAEPAVLLINKKEGKLSTVINAGDCIDFVPAVPGVPANVCLGDIEGADRCLEITLNGRIMPLDTPLRIGDVIRIRMPKEVSEKEEPVRSVRTERADSMRTSDAEEDWEEDTEQNEDADWEEDTDQRGNTDREGDAGQDGYAEQRRDAGRRREDDQESFAPDESGRQEEAVRPRARVSYTDVPATGKPDTEALGKPPESDAGADTGDTVVSEEVHEGIDEYIEYEDRAIEDEQLVLKFGAGEDDLLDVPAQEAGSKLTAGTEASGRPGRAGTGVSGRLSRAGTEVSGQPGRARTGVSGQPGRAGTEVSGQPGRAGTGVSGQPGRTETEVSGQERAGTGVPERPEGMSIRSRLARPSGQGRQGQLSAPGVSEAPAGQNGAERGTGQSMSGAVPVQSRPEVIFKLNGSTLRLPQKEDGGAYYLMDLLQYSGIDLHHPKGTINLLVNGEPGMFQQKLAAGDVIVIEEEKI